MKILLIYPPVIFSNRSYLPNVHLPLGILYIAAFIQSKCDDQVEVYDTRLNARLGSEGRFLRLGDTWKEIENNIYKAKPDIVGISNLSFAQFPNLSKIAETVKKIEKKTVVIVGGQHPSVCPEELLMDFNIDVVIKGEGEETFFQLLRNLKTKNSVEAIEGVITRKKLSDPGHLSGQKFIFDLDTLPFPAYHLYDMERYFYLQNIGFSSRFRSSGERPISLITSRGCPFSCIFCLGSGVMGKRWRAHSAEYVLKHIDFLIKEFKIDIIHFEDDNLNFDYHRFEKLLYGLKNLHPPIIWDTPNGVRAEKLDMSLLQKAKASHCDYLILGAESGEQRVLDEVIHKNLKIQSVIDAARFCNSLKVRLFAFFVIGFPGEKITEMKKTIKFALQLFWRYNVIPAIFWASPYKGTELYELCKKNNYFTEPITPGSFIDDHQLQGKILIETEGFAPREIKKILAMFRNKLKWFILLKSLVHPYFAMGLLSMVFKNRTLIRHYMKGHRNARLAH